MFFEDALAVIDNDLQDVVNDIFDDVIGDLLGGEEGDFFDEFFDDPFADFEDSFAFDTEFGFEDEFGPDDDFFDLGDVFDFLDDDVVPTDEEVIPPTDFDEILVGSVSNDTLAGSGVNTNYYFSESSIGGTDTITDAGGINQLAFDSLNDTVIKFTIDGSEATDGNVEIWGAPGQSGNIGADTSGASNATYTLTNSAYNNGTGDSTISFNDIGQYLFADTATPTLSGGFSTHTEEDLSGTPTEADSGDVIVMPTLEAGDFGYVVAGGSGADTFNLDDSAMDGVIVFGKGGGDTFNVTTQMDSLLIGGITTTDNNDTNSDDIPDTNLNTFDYSTLLDASNSATLATTATGLNASIFSFFESEDNKFETTAVVDYVESSVTSMNNILWDVGHFIGSAAKDTIALFGAKINEIEGGSGNDSITADVNSRVLTVDGGAGNDTLSVFVSTLTANAVTLRGGTASTDVDTGDVLTIKGGGTLSATNLANVIGWDTWTLASAQAYTLTLNTANAGTGALTIDASSATSLTLDGSAETNGGTITVTGSAGVDTITGGSGADTFTGGGGADTLTGAGNSDTFRFTAISDSTSTARDTITDFAATDDSEDIFLDSLGVGTFSFVGASSNNFAGSGNTSARFDDTNERLEIDIDGDGTADMEITLTGVTASQLAAADFTVTLSGLQSVSGTQNVTLTSGADIITGSGSNDIITLIGNAAAGDNVDLAVGTGDSLILAAGGNTISIANVEALTGGSGVDVVTVTAGGNIATLASGLAAADTLISSLTQTLTAVTIASSFTNQGALTVQGTNSFSNSTASSFSNALGATLTVQSNDSGGSAVLTIATGFTNTGTIIQDNISSQGFSNTLTLTTGAITNTGTIRFDNTTSAGGRTFNGNITNQSGGIIDVDDGTTMGKSGAVYTNAGTIDIDSTLTIDNFTSLTNSGTIDIASGSTLTLLDGTTTTAIVNAGTLSVESGGVLNFNVAQTIASGATLEVKGGSDIGGTGTLTNQGSLILNDGQVTNTLVNSATITVQNGSNTIDGTLTNSGTLLVQSNDSGGSAVLTIATGFTNTGTIIQDNISSQGFSNTLTLTTGAITNTGTIRFDNTTSAGGRTFNGNITNQSGGTIDVDDGTTFTNASGATLELESATSGTSALVTIANGFTNAGTIRLDNATGNSNVAAGLTVSSGTLTNTGTILSTNTSGDTDSINSLTGTLTSSGTITATQSLTVNKSSATHVSSGIIDIAGSQTLTFSGTSTSLTNQSGGIIKTGESLSLIGTLNVFAVTFTNLGTLSPGGDDALGTLNITGNVAQTSTSMLGIDITSTTTYDQMNVSGSYAVDGTLALDFRPGSAPTGGNSYANFVTYASKTGTVFDTVTHNLSAAYTLTVTINPNDIDLSIASTFQRTWDGGTSGTGTDFGTVSNWDADTLPSANNILINAATVVHATGTTTSINSLTASGTGSFTLSGGSLTLAAASRIDSATSFTFSGGTLAGAGTLYTMGAVTLGTATLDANLNLAGASTINSSSLGGAGTLTNLGSMTATSTGFTGTVTNTSGTFTVSGTSAFSKDTANSFTNASGATLKLEASSSSSSVSNLTIANAFTNAGTIILTDSTSLTSSSKLTVTTGTLTNTGTIQFANVNSTETLDADLSNTGLIDVNASATLNKTGGTHSSSGTIDIASGATLTVNGTSLANSGTINMTGGTLAGTAAVSNSGAILVQTGSATISSTFSNASGATLEIEVSTTSNANLTIANGFTNAGTLRFDDVTGNSTSRSGLTVTTGTLTNTGTIISVKGSGSINKVHSLTGALTSSGTIDVDQSLTINGIVTNTGTIDIAAGETLTITGSAFNNLTPGVIQSGTTGTLDVSGVTLFTNTGALSPGGAGAIGTLKVQGGTSAINGTLNVNAGGTLAIQGQGFTTPTLTLGGTATNAGLIQLDDIDNANADNAVLNITSGTLANTGTIQSLNTGGGGTGARTIAAQIDNQSGGIVNIDYTATVGKTGAAHLNSGTINIAASQTLFFTGDSFTNQSGGVINITTGGTLNTSGVTTYTQGGTLNTGLSPGIGTIVGNISQSAGGILVSEIADTAVGTGYDQLNISGNFQMGGTLDVRLIDGFAPVANDSFQVLTFGSGTGAFDAIAGLDLGTSMVLDAVITSTNLTLTATAATVSGTAAGETTSGTAGNDVISAGDGDDIIIGSAGDDLIFGGAGSDTVDYSGAAGDIAVSLAELFRQAVGADQGVDLLNGVENVIGSAGNDVLTGDSGASVLTGGTGADTLNLGSVDGSADIIRYTAFSDGAGDLTLADADAITQFEAGTDTIQFVNAGISLNGTGVVSIASGAADLNGTTNGVFYVNDATAAELGNLANVQSAIGALANVGVGEKGVFVVQNTASTQTGIYAFTDDGSADNTIAAAELDLMAVVDAVITDIDVNVV